MKHTTKISLIIPCLNEEQSIAQVIVSMRNAVLDLKNTEFRCIVADNGSTDSSAEVAIKAGATVIGVPIKGYGNACLSAMKVLEKDSDIVVFADGDGADSAEDIAALLSPIIAGQADFVLASRALGKQFSFNEKGALTLPQLFGNALSCYLLEDIFGMKFTDLGPFRAISYAALLSLQMDDLNFGWTLQMQARAAHAQLRIQEIPAHYYRRKTGTSKVSGNVKGSFLAGVIILRTVFKEAYLVHKKAQK